MLEREDAANIRIMLLMIFLLGSYNLTVLITFGTTFIVQYLTAH